MKYFLAMKVQPAFDFSECNLLKPDTLSTIYSLFPLSYFFITFYYFTFWLLFFFFIVQNKQLINFETDKKHVTKNTIVDRTIVKKKKTEYPVQECFNFSAICNLPGKVYGKNRGLICSRNLFCSSKISWFFSQFYNFFSQFLNNNFWFFS